jgi:glycerophosphoryl diester phosphodiesterase
MSKIDLYNGIKTDLTALRYTKGDGNTDTIKYIGLWRNQIQNERYEIPFGCPAVLIEFETSNFMEGSSKVYQEIDMTVRLHILFETKITDDLDILLLSQAIYAQMQFKQYGYWGLMKRRAEIQNFDHDNVQDFIQEYDCGKGFDYSADQRNTTTAEIDIININIENELKP